MTNVLEKYNKILHFSVLWYSNLTLLKLFIGYVNFIGFILYIFKIYKCKTSQKENINTTGLNINLTTTAHKNNVLLLSVLWYNRIFLFFLFPFSITLVWTACVSLDIPCFFMWSENWIQSYVKFTLTCSSVQLKPTWPDLWCQPNVTTLS